MRLWLGRIPSIMRRAYQTDLSDEEWEILEPHLPVPEAPGRPRRLHPLREILNALSSIWCEVAAPGDYFCPTTSRRGGPSTTTTSEPGESTALGSGCMKLFAGGRGSSSDETRSPALASSTARA